MPQEKGVLITEKRGKSGESSQFSTSQFVAWVAIAILLRITWMVYTGYLAEDAFITYRYAQQISQGHGFVYNLGEHIYGTTTPLYTLLMAIWLKLTNNVALGAHLFDLAAAGFSFYFLGLAMRRLSVSRNSQFFIFTVLALSPKLISKDTQGMETSLVLMLMATSWYTFIRGDMKWTGLLCGLLLWTRIDTFLWPLSLAMIDILPNWKKNITLLTLAGLTYLPWVIFATWYFGSPIPHTVTAKWIVYIQNNLTPLGSHLSTLIKYIPPMYIPEIGGNSAWKISIGALTVLLAAFGAAKVIRNKPFTALIVFAALEITRLVLTRATFFTRYFIPPIWALFILIGIALANLWDYQRKATHTSQIVIRMLVPIFFALVTFSGLTLAESQRDTQQIRHESSLKAMGLWLSEHTQPEKTVFLEPLGYVGYYAGRPMLDEVGLVTPSVLEFKRKQQYDVYTYLPILQPDYIIAHCDDALRWQEQSADDHDGFTIHYSLAVVFNPHNFDPMNPGAVSETNVLARNACYEIWGPRH